jgi:hypothetical protein
MSALAKYDDATLIAELESRTQRALARSVIYADNLGRIPERNADAWQESARRGSGLLLVAIERAGVRP